MCCVAFGSPERTIKWTAHCAIASAEKLGHDPRGVPNGLEAIYCKFGRVVGVARNHLLSTLFAAKRNHWTSVPVGRIIHWRISREVHQRVEDRPGRRCCRF